MSGNDNQEQVFRTKRGHCIIRDGNLELESSIVGYLRHLRNGNRLLFWGYVLAPISVASLVIIQLVSGDISPLTLLLAAAVFLAVLLILRLINQLRGFNNDKKIPIKNINRVVAVGGTKGLTRPRFIVEYENESGTGKRYIMMPSKWLSYGENEFMKAKRVFQELGVPVQG